MKEFKDMDHKEKVDYAVGSLLIAIGEGKFRDAVASLIGAVSADAYQRGKMYAYEHPNPVEGDIPPDLRAKMKPGETLAQYYERTDPL